MKAEEFVAKFPDAERNQSWLENIACPKCGQRERFRIEMIIIADVTDDETNRDGDCQYDDDSYCECGECPNCGKLVVFTIKGLDDLLEEGEE